ncbi:hypothetical protein LAV72_19005 [Lysinibacillus xylanilyticus]|uniref:hypothetical protein n=1 Tax=Lysinibacillus xylanilyticus TaxID=582475 RepID=UPI002B240561|nr:hypothetical protein [Lysinibacillus xylanilyticus]MEB2301698.1 hypothetical protein [Lysinibacillus xylanilyticus]
MLGLVSIFIIFGIVLTTWGIYRMKTDDGIFGNNQKSKNIFNLFLHGQASGIGQFLSGIACIIIGIVALLIG